MKITITIECASLAFQEDLEGELERVLLTVVRKVGAQLARKPGCLCVAPEAADVLRDLNGNVVGQLVVEEAS